MTNPIRLLVVDDHTLFRRGLIALLGQYADLSVVGDAGDAGQAQRKAAELQPDLILLDLHLPSVNGIDALAGLREASPKARIAMLTVSEDQQDMAAALRHGANGYLLKTIDGDELADAVRHCVNGTSVVTPSMTGKLVALLQGSLGRTEAKSEAPDAFDALSPRELDALREIARGSSNKEIARKLVIAEATVKVHVQHILRKLNLSSRVQAAVFANAKGCLSDH